MRITGAIQLLLNKKNSFGEAWSEIIEQINLDKNFIRLQKIEKLFQF